MMRRQNEVRYRSKLDSAFQLDYPVRLVASLAAQILGQDVEHSNSQAFHDAVKCACKLIDVSYEVAAQHYTEAHGLIPLLRNEQQLSFEEAVSRIVGKDRFKKRRQDAIKDFKKYYSTQASMFYEVTDDDAVAVENPESAAYKRMMSVLEDFKHRGMTTSQADELRKGYAEWKKRNILEVRAAAGTKGGVAKAKKPPAKHSGTGKFKKSEEFFLTPDEKKALDAKAADLADKQAKKRPS